MTPIYYVRPSNQFQLMELWRNQSGAPWQRRKLLLAFASVRVPWSLYLGWLLGGLVSFSESTLVIWERDKCCRWIRSGGRNGSGSSSHWIIISGTMTAGQYRSVGVVMWISYYSGIVQWFIITHPWTSIPMATNNIKYRNKKTITSSVIQTMNMVGSAHPNMFLSLFLGTYNTDGESYFINWWLRNRFYKPAPVGMAEESEGELPSLEETRRKWNTPHLIHLSSPLE